MVAPQAPLTRTPTHSLAPHHTQVNRWSTRGGDCSTERGGPHHNSGGPKQTARQAPPSVVVVVVKSSKQARGTMVYLDSMFESGGSRRASKADWIYSFFALTLVVLFFHPVRA
jgi:hypothetical protein